MSQAFAFTKLPACRDPLWFIIQHETHWRPGRVCLLKSGVAWKECLPQNSTVPSHHLFRHKHHQSSKEQCSANLDVSVSKFHVGTVSNVVDVSLGFFTCFFPGTMHSCDVECKGLKTGPSLLKCWVRWPGTKADQHRGFHHGNNAKQQSMVSFQNHFLGSAHNALETGILW